MQCDTIMTQWKYFMKCSVCSVLVYLSQTNALGFGRVLSALPNCLYFPGMSSSSGWQFIFHVTCAVCRLLGAVCVHSQLQNATRAFVWTRSANPFSRTSLDQRTFKSNWSLLVVKSSWKYLRLEVITLRCAGRRAPSTVVPMQNRRSASAGSSLSWRAGNDWTNSTTTNPSRTEAITGGFCLFSLVFRFLPRFYIPFTPFLACSPTYRKSKLSLKVLRLKYCYPFKTGWATPFWWYAAT